MTPRCVSSIASRGTGQAARRTASPAASSRATSAATAAAVPGRVFAATIASSSTTIRGTAAELSQHFSETEPRGEIVVVIGAAPEEVASLGPALEALSKLVEAGAKKRPAAQVVSDLTGVSANTLYRALTER